MASQGIDDIDVWRAAQLLIKQHDDPEMVAAARIDQMIEAGDPAGEATWKLILKAVRELTRGKPREGERLN